MWARVALNLVDFCSFCRSANKLAINVVKKLKDSQKTRIQGKSLLNDDEESQDEGTTCEMEENKNWSP